MIFIGEVLMVVKVGINGFGHYPVVLLSVIYQNVEGVEVTRINDLTDQLCLHTC